jgi:hypothetical protein
MVVGLPCDRILEVRKLADTRWRWIPRRAAFPPHWLYWGWFAVCLAPDVRHARPLADIA